VALAPTARRRQDAVVLTAILHCKIVATAQDLRRGPQAAAARMANRVRVVGLARATHTSLTDGVLADGVLADMMLADLLIAGLVSIDTVRRIRKEFSSISTRTTTINSVAMSL